MRQTSFASMHCSLGRSLELMGYWWTPLILRDLMFGPRRFDEFAEDLGMSRTLLTTRLKELTEANLIVRTPYREHPLRHHYELTESGRELVPILMSLMTWGDRWTKPPGGPPLMFQHRKCGQIFSAVTSCSHCGEPVSAEDVQFLAGPGARNRAGTALQRNFIAEANDPPVPAAGR